MITRHCTRGEGGTCSRMCSICWANQPSPPHSQPPCMRVRCRSCTARAVYSPRDEAAGPHPPHSRCASSCAGHPCRACCRGVPGGEGARRSTFDAKRPARFTLSAVQPQTCPHDPTHCRLSARAAARKRQMRIGWQLRSDARTTRPQSVPARQRQRATKRPGPRSSVRAMPRVVGATATITATRRRRSATGKTCAAARASRERVPRQRLRRRRRWRRRADSAPGERVGERRSRLRPQLRWTALLSPRPIAAAHWGAAHPTSHQRCATAVAGDLKQPQPPCHSPVVAATVTCCKQRRPPQRLWAHAASARAASLRPLLPLPGPLHRADGGSAKQRRRLEVAAARPVVRHWAPVRRRVAGKSERACAVAYVRRCGVRACTLLRTVEVSDLTF